MKKIFYTFAIFGLFLTAAAGPAFSQQMPMAKFKLSEYMFRDKRAYPIDKMEVTLNVSADGRIGGKSGCNVYGADFSITDGKLKVSSPISTMMFCDEVTNGFERKFLDVLQNADTFSLKDKKLTIKSTARHTYLVFEPVAEPSPETCCAKPTVSSPADRPTKNK
ncbi:MAG: META domain protein [Acidobacteria bacterium OLB17]|nr:MAG: META domain protein [Acidobacteria bacterium OLB17]MCZ2390778.1 META domain-containing protein [Acidobacteriota bacterium]